MKIIYIFTMDSCMMCKKTTRLLTNAKISFKEINIVINKKLWKDVVRQNDGLNTVPSIFIRNNNDDNGLIYSPGRDFTFPEEIIELIKKNI